MGFVFFRKKIIQGKSFSSLAVLSFLLLGCDDGPKAPALKLKNPVKSPGNVAAPTITVSSVLSGYTVTLYNGEGCSGATAGSGKVGDDKGAIDIKANALTQDGTFNYYAKAVKKGEASSPCSKRLQYTLDTVAPEAPTLALKSPTTSSGAETKPTLTATNVVAGDIITLHQHSTENPKCEGDILATTTVGAGKDEVDLTPGEALDSGSHTFYAKAADVAGNKPACSEEVNYTVTAPDSSPTVTSVSVPSNKTYKIGDNLDFTVIFSETVDVAGIPRLILSVAGTTKHANYESGTGTGDIVFRYTVTSGDGEDTDGIELEAGGLSLNGGTIQDTVDQSATLTLNSIGTLTGVKVDGEKPTTLTLATPATINAQNESSYGLSGTCSENTQAVNVSIDDVGNSSSPAVTGTANCSVLGGNGAWAVSSLDVSAMDDETLDIDVTHLDAAGNSKAITGTVTKEATAPFTPAIARKTGLQATDNDTTPTFVVNFTASQGVTKAHIYEDGCSGTMVKGSTNVTGNLTTTADVTVSTALSTDNAYTYYAEVEDQNGNKTCSASGVSYTLDTTAPATAPTLAFASGNTANDNDTTPTIQVTFGSSQGVTSVKLYSQTSCGGTAVATASITNETQKDLTSSVLTAGSYVFSAGVSDAAGNQKCSSTTLNYSLDTTPPNVPTLSRKSPSAAVGTDSTPTLTASSVVSGHTITLHKASGCTDTALVTVTADATTEDLTPDSALSEGSYTFYARAEDPAGNSSCSTGVTYRYDVTAPTVSSVSVPSNNTYNIGDNLDFTVNFSEAVDVTGTPQLILTVVSNSKMANYRSGTGTSALVFRYTVVSGDGEDTNGIRLNTDGLSLNGGTIQDAVDQNATLTLNSIGTLTGVKVDGDPPSTLTLATPVGVSTNNESSYSLNGTCSENGQTVSLSIDDVGNSNSSAVTGNTSCSVSGGNGTWTVSSLNLSSLDNESLNITVTHEDAAGNTKQITGNVIKNASSPSRPIIARKSPLTATDNDTTPTFVISFTANQNIEHARIYETSGCTGTAKGSASVTGNSTTSADVTVSTALSTEQSYTYYAEVEDNASNRACSSSGITYTLDTTAPATAPTLALGSGMNSIDDDTTPTVRVTFGSGEVSSVKLYSQASCGGTVLATISVNSGTTRNLTSSALTDGAYTFSAGVSDIAGNEKCSAQTLSYTLDTMKPLFQVTPVRSVANKKFTVKFVFKEALKTSGVGSFEKSDISISNGTLGSTLSGPTSNSYTIDVTPNSDVSSVTLTVAANAVQDMAGNGIANSKRIIAMDYGVQVSAGGDHTCSNIDNQLECWGNDAYGVVGTGTSGDVHAVPVRLASGGYTKVRTSLVTGYSFSCAITTGKKVTCWGARHKHQLGDGVSTSGNVTSAGSVIVKKSSDDSELSNVTDIVLGYHHACALVGNSGDVYCWGQDQSGATGQRSESTDGNVSKASQVYASSSGSKKLSGASALAAGGHHTCVLMKDSSVKCWGENTLLQLGETASNTSTTCGGTGVTACSGYPVDVLAPTGTGGLKGIVQISANKNNTCALNGNGEIYCWGGGANGVLGNNTTANNPRPAKVSNINNAIMVSVGTEHACAVLSTGAMKCWGKDGYGKLGNGTSDTNQKNTPDNVDYISTAVAVSAGYDHTCAVLKDKSVYCWGRGNSGRLGTGTANNKAAPVRAITSYQGQLIAAGGSHSCGRVAVGTDEGEVKCWGDNTDGQVGDNTTTKRASATSVKTSASSNPKIEKVVSVASTNHHACALTSEGKVSCWGNGASGQLGDGATDDNTVATEISLGSGIKASVVSAGDAHSCAVTTAGKAMCWGEGEDGRLGQGTAITDEDSPITVKSAANTDATGIASIAAGGEFTCVLKTGGKVNCWGDNDSKQLGTGSSSTKGNFMSGDDVALGHNITTTDLTGIKQIVAGGSHACALKEDGKVYCWGDGGNGKLGNNSTDDKNGAVEVSSITNAVAISAGGEHTCALLEDSSLKCWGENGSGQLGDDSTTDRNTPVSVVPDGSTTPIKGFVAVQAGKSHTCALKSTGAAQCWGESDNDRLGLGSNPPSGDQNNPQTVDSF